MRPKYKTLGWIALGLLGAACGTRPDAGGVAVQATYDKGTGKLSTLTADTNHDGKIDTWTYMDGAVPLRTEQDLDGDGRIERWEYTRPDGSNAQIAVSRRATGQPDMWTYLDEKGTTTRVETASADAVQAGQKARVDRTEYYEAGRLVRVEEDTDGDGKVDKWEAHDGPAVLWLELDTDKNGTPDERITFGPAGQVVRRDKIEKGRA